VLFSPAKYGFNNPDERDADGTADNYNGYEKNKWHMLSPIQFDFTPAREKMHRRELCRCID
jgi:hypothetical protein